MSEDKAISFREVKEDDFKKGLLSGEINPHDVEITIKYKNGKITTGIIKWDVILSLYTHHNKCAVGETYELMVDSFV